MDPSVGHLSVGSTITVVRCKGLRENTAKINKYINAIPNHRLCLNYL